MARSPASLVKLWDYEGQPSSSGVRTNELKVATAVSGTNVKEELLKYYHKHGMESMAKEVGIIHANGDAGAARQQVQPTQRKAIIAVPVVSKAGVATMSPFKTDQTILPKTVHLANSPVILSTPQRVVANVISTPRTPQQTVSTPSDHLTWSGKRPHGSTTDTDYSESKKCKKGEKGGKGLRHFSMKVCEKVRKKGTTSYNEVADELVAEFTDPHRSFSPTEQAYDQKNIRRRVYDALNVLMAMNIISKEKKEIKWLGLPTNSAQEYQNLEREKQKRIERIRLKTQQLQELIQQQVAFKNLIERNKMLERQNAFPSHSSRIHLPFIIVNTDKKTVIDCSISPDKTEYLFHFNDTFQIHDDIEILKRMGMVLNLDKGCCSSEELEKAKQLVPKALQPYVIQMAQGISDFPPGMSGEGGGIKIENNLYSDQTSDFQEPSSSALDSEYVGIDVAVEGSQVGLSRQSSVGSLSDMPSRAEASTPSDFSESESESSCTEDI